MLSHHSLPFLWGAATSSHQVEGQNSRNDWWAWEQAGLLKEPSGLACDHYRRYREDFDLLSKLGHSAHRFSIEWSRLEPEENQWDEEAFRHYQSVLEELRLRGIEPVVTLHHFTNPQWFAEKGGWTNSEAVFYFSRYTQRVVSRLGRYVKFWITINEPLVYLYHGFFAGLWPPGMKSFGAALRVFRNQVAAHSEAYRIIHHHYQQWETTPVWVSLAMHISHFTPCREHSLADRFTVWVRNWFANDAMLEAARSGFLFFPGLFCEFLSASRCLDFIGLNYYTRDFIRFRSFWGDGFVGDVCSKDHHLGQVKDLNSMGWEICSEGLYSVLKRLRKYRLPIMVTENGIAAQDDAQRIRFIQDHLQALRRARMEGVDIIGYLHWSLLDNFEWAHGFEPRFGLVEVNYQTQERKVRKSAQVLSDLCRQIERDIQNV